MGSDSHSKSAKFEQRQRLTIVISLIALSTALFLVISMLKAPAKEVSGPDNGSTSNAAARTAAMIQQMDSSAGSTKLRAQPKQHPPKDPRDDAALPIPAAQSQKSETEAALLRAHLEAQVRDIKNTGVIMEADEKSLELTAKLQDATRELIALRYGESTDHVKFRVKFDLEFQSTIPDFDTNGKDGSLLIELAPVSLLPCSVYNFLEIARTWKKGAFHRNAGHVLQAMTRSGITERMPFQEYSKAYPHKKGTLGYAGRPSGPEFYVSIQDNTQAHGPGSQQQANPYEADCIIGTVIQGMEDGTVARIHTMPGKEFMGDKKKWVLIRRMHILVPGDGPEASPGGYVEFSHSPLEIPAD